MSDAAQFSADGVADFPFVKDVPVAEPSRVSRFLRDISELKAAQEKHGLVIPVHFIHTVLGVSRQRVHQIMESGVLPFLVIAGRKYVTEDALVAHVKQMPSTGQKYNLPKSTGDCFKRALAHGKSVFSR